MRFRFRVLTHKQIQLRLESIFLLWFLVFLALFGAIFLINFATVSQRITELPLSDQLLAKMVLVNQTRDLAKYYGLAMLVYCVFVWFYVIVYSNRLTGPVYNMTKTLERAAKKGLIPKNIKFRKTDAFPELEIAFNDFLKSIADKAPDLLEKPSPKN